MTDLSVWETKKDPNAFFLETQQTMLQTGASVLSTSKTITVFDPLKPSDTKPAPSNVGISQQCTTLLIRKLDGVYIMLADGVEIQSDESGEYWLPRFCDVPATNETPRTVGPLCIGLRVEAGEVAPSSAAVNLKQSIVDDGTLLLDSTDVLQQPEPLEAHRPHEPVSAFGLFPYPATIIRPPTVTIVDMAEQRRWEWKQKKWNRSRTWDVIQAVGVTVGLLTAVSTGTGSLTLVAKQWFTEGLGTASSTLWKLAAYKASPTLAKLVSTSWEVMSFPFKRFSAVEPPPTRLKTYQFTATQMISALEKMAKTDEYTGDVKGIPIELSPYQFGQAGYEPEAALLEYLLFGNSSKLDATSNGLADPVEDKDGNNTLWSTLKAPWTMSTKSLTGNLLNPSSLSLPICMQTRVEYSVEITVVDPTLPNGSMTFKLRPLQHNAVDAGLIYSGIELQHSRLAEARKKVVEKLGRLSSFGFASSWMHNRLYVSTQPSSSIFGLATLRSISEELKKLATASTSTDEETKRRWESLGTDSKSKASNIVFSAADFKRRLNRILYGKAVNEKGVVSNSYYKGGNALSERRRNNVVGTGGGLFTSGLTTEQYEAMLGERSDLYRKTIGDATGSFVVEQSRAFWRFVDTHIPLGSIDDFRLANFLVPKISNVKAFPELIQRIPQVGVPSSKRLSVFGNVSLLPVRSIPGETISERKNAKLAVETTRRCWSDAATTYSQLNWTVESKSIHGFLNAFHFHIIYTIEAHAKLSLGFSNRYQPARILKPNTLVLTGCQPAQVSQLEALYQQSNPMNGLDVLNDALHGDALLLSQLKLDATRINMLAVHVHASISSERAFNIANSEANELETNITTKQVSKIIEQLFGASTKVRTLISEHDILFACFPATREVVRALFHVFAWREVQTNLEASERDATLLPVVNLRDDEKQLVTIFARSLYKLSTSTNPKMLSQIPVTPYQSMWFTANPAIHKLQLYNEQYRRKAGVQIQYEEASHSLTRVKTMTSNFETSKVALACVDANRPVLKLVHKIEFRSNGLLTKSEPVVHSIGLHNPFNQSMKFQVLAHLRYRAVCLRTHTDAGLSSVMKQLSLGDPVELTPGESDVTNPSSLRFRVPVGCPFSEIGNGLAHALSYTSSLEDLVVLPSLVLETLPLLFTNCIDCKIRARPLAQNGQEGGRGRIVHPHEIRIKRHSNNTTQTWHLYLSSLSDSVVQSLDTWTLHDPVRSLLFNVDRISQLLVLAEVEDMSTDPIVLELADSDFNTSRVVALVAVACALGECVASTQLGCSLRHCIRVQHGLTGKEATALLYDNIKRFKDMMLALNGTPAPLSEVCLSVACSK